MSKTAAELVEEMGDYLDAPKRPFVDIYADAEAHDAEVAALRASNAEMMPAFMASQDVDRTASRLRARVAELETPRNPNALELAERYAAAHVAESNDDIHEPIGALHAWLRDYDKR